MSITGHVAGSLSCTLCFHGGQMDTLPSLLASDIGHHNSYPCQKYKPLPLDTMTYSDQIGGHGASGNKNGVLCSKERNVIFKPVQKYPKGPHEVVFYQHVFDPGCKDATRLALRAFVPTYKGLYTDDVTQTLYLCLQNVLAGFQHPSICDVKMGRQTYAPNASLDKIKVEQAKYKWQSELGFCLSAMKLFDPDSNEPVYLNRDYGRSLDPNTIYDQGIRVFLGSDPQRAQRLAQAFLKRLNDLKFWFEHQHQFSFYASSLLLAYDSVSSDAPDLISVYLIDFARWHPLNSTEGTEPVDENFLFGLNRLCEMFKRAAVAAVASSV